MSIKQAFAGIDIGGTSVKFGLFSPDGTIIYKEQKPTLAEKGAVPLMHLVANIAEQLMYHAAEDELEVRWLGVGTPGAVDFKTGRVIGATPNIEGWQGTEIGSTLKERLNMPVWVDNDVNTVALAELRYGAATGAQSAVCVTIGTGIGGAVVIDGQIQRGHSYSGGEIGHMSINFEGPDCKCGRKGCLEVYCSSQAIINRTKKRLEQHSSQLFDEISGGQIDKLTIKQLFTAAKRGDKIANEVLAETAQYLGIGLANLVNLLNPEIIIIGGGIADGGPEFLSKLSLAVKEQAFDSAVKELKIVKATLGNDAGFIGAGLLGENQY